METKPEQRLKTQVGRLKTILRDKLGDGIWGLEKKDNFTHEEIVFLFARIFRVLGFDYIKKIRTEFPDCICMIGDTEVGVEFEPVLSSFGDHLSKHDLKLCQYIVCWKDDLSLHDSMWEEIRKFNIEILKLKDIYEDFKIQDKDESRVIAQSDIDGIKPNGLKILRTFIELEKDILTIKEIAEATGIHGKAFTGAISGPTQMQKGRIDWILRKRPGIGWEINPQHKSKIVATLKKYNLYG